MMTIFVPTVDCGKAGYKTEREIELEKKLDIAVNAINSALEVLNEALVKIKEIN